MSKADKIENAMLKIIGIGVGIMAIHAARKAAYRKGTEDYYKDKHNKYDRLNDDDLTIAIKENDLNNSIKEKDLNNSIKGIGRTFDAKFKHYVYVLNCEMANGDKFIVNRIAFASSIDAEMYLNKTLRKDLELKYTVPFGSVDGYYEVTEKATGKLLATIYIDSLYYYE